MVWRVFTSTKANPPDQKQYFWWTVQGDICRPYLDPNYHDSSTAASRYLNAKFDHFAYEQITTKNASNGRDPLRDTCDQYLRRKHFVLSSLSDEEKSFPLAYSILVYKDYPQVEQLIRTIYRPEHTICVHVDVKASSQLLQQLQHLVECFPREVVFLSKRRLSVQWGKFSTLEADLICMAELWGLWPTRKWKYFINLTGQEYPLRTNLELVRILRQLNGSNAIEGLSQQQEFSRHPKTKLPFAVKWIKGAVHIVATNSFVNFSLHDTKALAILDLLKKEAQIPDELYFSTLNHNPQLGTPGAYLGFPETNDKTYPYINRAKEWVTEKELPSPRCLSGRVVRLICIVGIDDVPRLMYRHELFVNKLHWDFNNLASMCLQEWYWDRSRQEYLSASHDVAINLTWYSQLPNVRWHQ